jgi:uncharacterized membrane protein YphA (DoxX/SURF4 family)
MTNFSTTSGAARLIFSTYESIEGTLIEWVEKHDPLLARLAMAVVYFWFGILKLFGLSPANPMIQSLQARTLPFLSFDQFIILFALFEMLIGILFLIPKATRVVMLLFLFHMVTTTMPLFILPKMTWQSALVPTMEGQYIIKNVVLIALAANLGASLRRGIRRSLPGEIGIGSVRPASLDSGRGLAQAATAFSTLSV